MVVRTRCEDHFDWKLRPCHPKDGWVSFAPFFGKGRKMDGAEKSEGRNLMFLPFHLSAKPPSSGAIERLHFAILAETPVFVHLPGRGFFKRRNPRVY